MTGHERIGGDPIVVVDGMNDCVADTAVGNRNTNIMLPKFRRRILEWLKRLCHTLRGVSEDGDCRHWLDLLSPIRTLTRERAEMLPNGLELSCPAEAGIAPPLYASL